MSQKVFTKTNGRCKTMTNFFREDEGVPQVVGRSPGREESDTVSTSRSQMYRCHQKLMARRGQSRNLLAWALASSFVLLVLARQIKAQTDQPNISTPTPMAISHGPSKLGEAPETQTTNAPQQQNKLKPVNFTLIDETFSSTVNESEVLRRWRAMDGQFQDGIRGILKLVFPQIVAISQDARVSGDCSGGILKWILSLRNLRSWAIKMLDATGKPTAGIFQGSLTMFGNHRQCLDIRAPDEDEIEITEQFEEYFRGQFCVLHLRPWLSSKKPFYNLNATIEPLIRKSYKYYEKTLYDELAEIATAFNFIDIRMDLCVPSTCTIADIQRVADLLSRKLEMRSKVMRCDIEPRILGSFLQNLDRSTMMWLLFPTVLIIVTLSSTVLVFVQPARETGASEFSCWSCWSWIYLLSLQAAFHNLLHCANSITTRQILNDVTVNRNPTQTNANVCKQNDPEMFERPMPLYGLRNLFVIWFIIVQLTVELKYQYLRESLVLRNMMLTYWPFQVIINTSMIFESLILITAFTFSYRNLEMSTKSLVARLVDKYIRLMPSIATLVMVTTVLPDIGVSSPVWKNFVEQQSEVCKSNGYLNLFFLQNFISYDKICMPHTWLFCVELQLVALSLPLVILFKRTFIRNEDLLMIAKSSKDLSLKRDCAEGHTSGRSIPSLTSLLKSKVGFLGFAIISVGVAINFILVHSGQLPPAWFHTFPDTEQKNYYFGSYLTKTWTHLTTFVVGLYAGYLCRSLIQLTFCRGIPTSSVSSDSSNQVKYNSTTTSKRIQRVTLQAAAFGCLLSIIFSTFSWSTLDLPSPFVSALYDAASRLVWSIALAGLMIQLCMPNQDGSYSRLSSVFSHPLCVVLGKLSFLAYLISPLVHTFVLAVQEQSLFPSLYLIFHVVVGNLVITYLLAFILSLMIELPVRLFSKQLCSIIWQSRKCATVSTANVTTTTSATSLAS